jgi:membrane protein implicated in regulation of membrane protease activity
MVKLSKELTLGVLLVVIVIMVLKPNLLGFLYNNILGKIIFVAAVVFLSLKHTAAGLLAVVFVAIVASMSGYHGFEGMEVPSDEEDDEKKKEKKEEGFDGKKKKCEGEDCDADMEGAETQKKPDSVKDIEALLKTK